MGGRGAGVELGCASGRGRRVWMLLQQSSVSLGGAILFLPAVVRVFGEWVS